MNKKKDIIYDSEIFIHIGMHKTGSSFLQNEIFPKLDINYFRPKDEYIIKPGKNLISNESFMGNPFIDSDFDRRLMW